MNGAERKTAGGRVRAGFTLVELLVTLAVTSVLLAFVYQIFISQQRSQSIQEEVADAQQNARVTVDELTRALTSVGAGVVAEQGQVRILVAHPDEFVFNADLDDADDAMAVGAAVPGATPGTDPYATIPGTYASSPAETYRFYLSPDGAHHILRREVNDGTGQQVALNIASRRIGEPLFSYFGDFDGDGNPEILDRVDITTSPRIAAGEPLDAVIRRIDLNVVTETAHPDPRYPSNQGYRLTRFRTSVAPRNLWDCPVISPNGNTVPIPPLLPRAPDLRGTTTQFQFRVTRGGVPEPGRTVVFSLLTPPLPGGPGPFPVVTDLSGASDRDTTDANGIVTAVLHWPAPPPTCDELPEGAYTVLARTAEPPTLTGPFGTCAPHEARQDLEVVAGLPDSVQFANPLLAVASCGNLVTNQYDILDACQRPARDEDVAANPVDLGIGPDPDFGHLNPVSLTTSHGEVEYLSRDVAYAAFAVSRSPLDPNRFLAWVEADPTHLPAGGRYDLEVFLEPTLLTNLTRNIPATAFEDCPTPPGPVDDTFNVEDACGNPLYTLQGTGETVELRLEPDPNRPATDQGTIESVGNPPPAIPPARVTIVDNDGTPPGGIFSARYQAPTCSVGGLSYAPELIVTPSWNPALQATLPVSLAPCTGCSVQVLDASGLLTTQLNQACDAQGEIRITQCVPSGTTVEVVIEPEPGSLGLPSFDRNGASDRVTLTFNAGVAGQIASIPFYVGTAQSGDAFRVAAYVPDQATANALGGVTCLSDRIDVTTDCSEILISAVPDNPQAVPANPAAQDTPLCAAENSEVFFRVEDCDQNVRDFASDDIQNTAGTSRGMLVQVMDTNGVVLDEEGPDLFEVDVHGIRATDSPYFQGSLTVTQDPNDLPFSGKLRVPLDRVVTLRANYVDPDDPTDIRCVAEALLVPPLPICLAAPVQSWGAWDGNLLVHGGDAVVVGDLRLPGPPGLSLVSKGLPPVLPPPSPFGALPKDPFFNAYIGGTISVGGTALAPIGNVEQPFTPTGAGSLYSITHPNYFQAVPDAVGLTSRLDYDRLKLLARALGVYWEAVPSATGWLVSNPAKPQLGPMTFEEATRSGGLGGHQDDFVFVDAPAGLQGSGLIDSAALADLPTFVISGNYYSEGLIYVAGSVVFDTNSGQRPVAIEVASTADTRYDEANGGITRADLPLDFAPSPTGPIAVGNLPVNVRGALYLDGELRLPGGPRVYGAVAAERGVRDAGSAEIWYDPRWMEGRVEICSTCCGLSLTPAAPVLALGDTLQLISGRAKGAVVWDSLTPQIATVDATGLVTSVAEGQAIIRAVDESGCVAEVEVRVRCGLALDVPGGTSLTLGAQATAVSTGHRGTVTWTVDGAAVAIIRDFGPTVDVEATAIGAAQLTATDGVSCSDIASFTVNCPGGRTLFATPSTPNPGDTVTLAVREGALDVTAEYSFSADGAALPAPSYLVPDLTPVQFQALLPGDVCPVGPLQVQPQCPTYTLTVAPNPLEVANDAQITVRDGSGTDVTNDFSLTVAPAGAGTLVLNTFTPSQGGTVFLSGTGPGGCPVGPVELSVTP